MKRDQLKTYQGRIIGTELFIPDLPRLAELYGAKGFSVTRKEELKSVFQQALASEIAYLGLRVSRDVVVKRYRCPQSLKTNTCKDFHFPKGGKDRCHFNYDG